MAEYEKVCPEHGHYKASLGSCPYCRGEGGLPHEPMSFHEEDNAATNINAGGGGRYSGGDDYENMETNIPNGKKGRKGDVNPDDESTFIPNKKDTDGTGTVLRSKEKVTPVEVILWMRNTPRRGKIFQIKNQDTIGRADEASKSHHYLDGDGVSGRHAKITCEEGKYYIWDLASTNGTFVNSERIYGRTLIQENDIITIDDFEFVVKILS